MNNDIQNIVEAYMSPRSNEAESVESMKLLTETVRHCIGPFIKYKQQLTHEFQNDSREHDDKPDVYQKLLRYDRIIDQSQHLLRSLEAEIRDYM